MTNTPTELPEEVESWWDRRPDYSITFEPIADRVLVHSGDTLLADSTSAVMLLEQDHVDRIYIPSADVRWDELVTTDLQTICPFKGLADYWAVKGSDADPAEVVWTYPEPFDEVAEVRDLVCFYDDRVEVVVG